MAKNVTALGTSKLANQAPSQVRSPHRSFRVPILILTYLKASQEAPASKNPYSMDKLLARLSEQQAILSQQNEALKSSEEEKSNAYSRSTDAASSSSSLPITPATDAFSSAAPTHRPASATLDDSRPEADEVLRLKLQLAQAQSQISKLDQELAKTRALKTEIDVPTIGGIRTMATAARDNTWAVADDAQSDTSDALSASAFGRTRGIWGNSKPAFVGNMSQSATSESSPASWFGGRGFSQGYVDSNTPYPVLDGCRGDRLTPDPDLLMRPSGASRRGNRFDSRFNSAQYGSGFGGVGGPVNQFDSMGESLSSVAVNAPPGLGPAGMSVYPSYQQQPIGTPLSPHASEFTSKASWKAEVSQPLPSQDATRGTDCFARLGLPTAQPIFLPPNPSTIDGSWTRTLVRTGSTLSTRLFATTTNKLPSSCSRNSKWVVRSKSTRLWRRL